MEAAASACLARLEASLRETTPDLDALAAFPAESLDAALRELARTRGADALPLLTTLAERAPRKELRRVARRALYRLAQAGIATPAAAPRPMVLRQPTRPVRAWVSGIDGHGSRAVWILFEGGPGQFSLCSVVINDQRGVVEAGGGPISRRRLEAQLKAITEEEKLMWVAAPPELAVGLVAEAVPLGAVPDFAPWRALFSTTPARPADSGEMESLKEEARQDPTLLDRGADLLDLPELAGWFLDPGAVQGDAVSLLEARGSRLVVSDQVKAEREAAITDVVIEREFTPAARARWARRLLEMAWLFRATGRARATTLACATALALEEPERAPRHLPFVRALVERGLEAATRVALGQASDREVSRAPEPSRVVGAS